jgi:hypothetical protein
MPSLKHRSPSLTAIYNALKSNPKNSILDLGSFSVNNFQFFSALGCHFHFLELNESIEKSNSIDIADFEIEVNRLLSDIEASRKFDVVFGWDLLNFLTLDKALILVNKINPFLRADSFFCFFLYLGARPQAPSQFKIEDQYFIEVHRSEGLGSEELEPEELGSEELETIPSALTSVALAKELPDYFLINNYRSLNGMLPSIAEQIFCFQPDAMQHKKISGSAEINDADTLVEHIFFSPAINLLRSDQYQGAVLDLGTKHVLNDDAWKRNFQQVHFADLPPILERFKKSSPLEKTAYLSAGNFLTYAEDTVFDAIVFWDFIAFTDDLLLEEISKRLNRHCRDGTLLVVMSHNGKAVPQSPLPFLLTQSGIGLCAHQKPKHLERTQPALSSLQIQKAFPNMYIKETFGARIGMLKGVTEYVFVYKDAATLAREKEELKQQVMERRQSLGLGAL